MKKIFTLCSLCLMLFFGTAQATTFHDYSTVTITGDSINLSQYYGKKVMVVNCASYCAYTPQYTQLQQVYDQYKSYGFEVIGFPSDDFGHQGGTDSAIEATCNSYNVTFTITEKVNVNTAPVYPVFDWLKKQTLNGVANASVTWNFNKFLIDEAGHWVQHYTSTTLPNDQAIINWILSPSALGVPPSMNLDDMIEMKSSNPTSTSIDFVVKNSGLKNLNIQLYSSAGNLIGSVYNGSVEGNQNISYSVSNLASGIYFVKIQAAGLQKTLRCSVIN